MKTRNLVGAGLVAVLSAAPMVVATGPAWSQSGSPCAPAQPSDRPPGRPNPGPPTGRPPEYPPGKCQLLLSRSVVAAGGSLQAAGAGFAPGSAVEMKLAGASLGTASAGGDGAFSAAVVVPASTDPGTHTFTASGAAVDGGTQVLSASLQVTKANARGSAPSSASESADLPRTGSSSTRPLALAGGLLLAAGVGAVVAARRRSSRTAG